MRSDIGPDRLPSVIVHGNSQDGETLILILFLELYEPRDLRLAWAAPGGPEVDQHNFAEIIGKIHSVSIGILQREVRGLLP